MRFLGIDFGAARIGLALGDAEIGLATPWQVLSVKSRLKLAAEIQSLVNQEQIDRLVVGIPRPLADQTRETDQAKDIRRFIAELKRLGLSVVEEDETLTSALAEKQTRAMGQRGKRDDLAAVAILQTYLDRQRQQEK